jgi:GT2 family glycosyltransferase
LGYADAQITTAPVTAATAVETTAAATVSIVFLVYNRREELRVSLRSMLEETDYPGDRVEVIVVDNASDDGSAEMIAGEFPRVRVIRRDENCGVSAWNDGFAVATGDYVLALDDDCYLPGDGLRLAVEAARREEADLVSFGVSALDRPDYRFNASYRTGLLSFWGCAVLIRRPVLEALRGYDPEIFVWANELEFMVRFFDRGFRHLHLPELVAVHMKVPGTDWRDYYASRAYRVNAEHFAYTAAKLFRRRDAAGALLALTAWSLRDAYRIDSATLQALRWSVRGFVNGLRHRQPVTNPRVSATYRRNFHSYASPWWLSRRPVDVLRGLPRELVSLARGDGRDAPRPPGRKDDYFAERARFYPDSAATLQF